MAIRPTKDTGFKAIINSGYLPRWIWSLAYHLATKSIYKVFVKRASEAYEKTCYQMLDKDS